jgi:hypothetical protein
MADTGTGTIGGKAFEIVGQFENYDELIERLRERAAGIELPYRVLDELAGLAEGHTGHLLGAMRKRHFSINSLLSVARALGVKSVMVVDETLVAEMKPMWQRRDSSRVHAKRCARIGATTMKRIVPIAAAEMGRRGGAKRRKLPPEVRRRLAQAAARARWQGRD